MRKIDTLSRPKPTSSDLRIDKPHPYKSGWLNPDRDGSAEFD